jgi:hypothetical protein
VRRENHFEASAVLRDNGSEVSARV